MLFVKTETTFSSFVSKGSDSIDQNSLFTWQIIENMPHSLRMIHSLHKFTKTITVILSADPTTNNSSLVEKESDTLSPCCFPAASLMSAVPPAPFQSFSHISRHVITHTMKEDFCYIANSDITGITYCTVLFPQTFKTHISSSMLSVKRSLLACFFN